jgi:hypothetical protein
MEESEIDKKKFSLTNIFELTLEAGLPEKCVISLAKELLNPTSRLLGHEEEPLLRETILAAMHAAYYTEFDDQVVLMEGGRKRRTRRRYKKSNK